MTSPLLAKIRFGPHLYGTSVPESDMDYRAVYLPPLSDLVLQRARDAWEDKVWKEIYAAVPTDGPGAILELSSVVHGTHTPAHQVPESVTFP